MKSIRSTALAVSVILALTSCSGIQRKEAALERARQIIDHLNIEQKASLLMHGSAPIDSLGIPAYNWWNEALHGVARNGSATVFPMPIGMAASFNAPLLEEVFTVVSDEARVKNRQAREQGFVGNYQGLTFWTPNINIFRDPRWGRGMETYGEDPYLTAMMGSAVVRGLQGPSDAPVLKAHACAKHFAVHSGPEWNRHEFDVNPSERDLRETYLPAFKELVTKAEVKEVMIAYNRFRGHPCGASDYLVNGILRGEWGFSGLVVSDCWAVHDFFVPGRHGYSPDAAHAVAAALNNGVDLECGDSYRHIPEAVSAGLLDEATVDRSLERVLCERIRLGELDAKDPWSKLDTAIIESDSHRALSLKMAHESLVLLQNKDGVLPLGKCSRIALLGPNADNAAMQWGNYNGIPRSTVTLKDALQQRVPSLTYIQGCPHVAGEAIPANLPEQLDGIDTVIFAGGLSPALEGEQMEVELPGFKGGDRTDIELPAVQRELLEALHSAGKTVILVNFSGSAVGLERETQSCAAILQAWYPGQEGGTAIADVLFGDVCPSGKLPVTFYRSIADLPDYENYDMQGRTYRFFGGKPLFPFGFGLSYTFFEYGKASVRRGHIIIPVTNTGGRDSSETVQLYVRRPDDPAGPRLSLRGFNKVSIKAGESIDVKIPLTEDTFTWWNEESGRMEPLHGEWDLLYGGDSQNLYSISYVFK